MSMAHTAAYNFRLLPQRPLKLLVPSTPTFMSA